MNERIPTETRHRTLGEALIQQVFTVTEKIDGKNKKIPVAGCRCLQGTLHRHSLFKVIRDNEVLHIGKLHMLKHFKSEVEDIKENMECGLALLNYDLDILAGDSILCFEEYDFQPKVDWTLPF